MVRRHELHLKLERVKTIQILPLDEDFIDYCVNRDEVYLQYAKGLLSTKPVYIITGLRIAQGAKSIRSTTGSTSGSTTGGPDFVLAYRLHKIKLDRAGRVVMRPKPYTKARGAAMLLG